MGCRQREGFGGKGGDGEKKAWRNGNVKGKGRGGCEQRGEVRGVGERKEGYGQKWGYRHCPVLSTRSLAVNPSRSRPYKRRSGGKWDVLPSRQEEEMSHHV